MHKLSNSIVSALIAKASVGISPVPFSVKPYGWLIGALGAGLVACSPIVAVHGIEPDPVVVDSFAIGETTQLEVKNAFGSPLTGSTFRPDVWYYTFQRTEALGFLKPKIVYQRIYAFDFDELGRLENIATLTEADGKDVEFASRVTPTRGTETNIFKEIFGNVGRFVGDEGAPSTPGGGPGGPGRP